ncbi:MAG: hypothetical protein WCQ95_02565 [Bacteroidota bacterium]
MKKIICLQLILLGLGLSLLAQNPNYQKYGMGYLVPEKGMTALNINFPNANFMLMNQPQGKKIGTIYKKDWLNLMYNIGNKSLRVRNEDLVEFAAKAYCLKYFEIKNNCVKVLVNSIRGGCWISIKELGYLRISYKNWSDYFIAQKQGFYPIVDVGLNLREQPDAKSKKVELLKGNCFRINLTGTMLGLWAQVEVEKFDTPPCKAKDAAQMKPQRQHNGWIKIIDEAGIPNIWFYVNGCQ